ncbi:MAG: spermidine synthase, partial [Gammaproteobacteria bacterium]
MPREIHTLGPVIAQRVDEDGPVRVHELEGHRYLTFGNRVEQSCIEIARPHRLAHAYTQAMMLSLPLRPDPAHALVLGLGGGSLVRALHHLDPGLAITAVERRPAVIALAGECLGLETGPHLSIHQAEAETFIAESGDHYDLVMVDLFLADGAHPAQGERDFLENCRARLSP